MMPLLLTRHFRYFIIFADFIAFGDAPSLLRWRRQYIIYAAYFFDDAIAFLFRRLAEMITHYCYDIVMPPRHFHTADCHITADDYAMMMPRVTT